MFRFSTDVFLIGIYCVPRRLKAAAIAFYIRTWRKLERERSSISRNILRITRFQDTTKFPRDISTYDGVNNGSLHSPEAAANSCEYCWLEETHLLQSTQVLKNVSIRSRDVPIGGHLIWYIYHFYIPEPTLTEIEAAKCKITLV